MKISIIVCAYNEEDSVGQCLISLLHQNNINAADYEIIVIDDESQDATGSIVESFINDNIDTDHVIKYFRIKHKGVSVARNTGLYKAQSAIIAYIDADAVATADWVCELLKAWNKSPDADAIGGRIRTRNAQSKVARFLHTFIYEHEDKKIIIGANMSFQRKKVLDVGGFGDFFESRGDEAFLVAKLGQKKKIVKWNSAIVYHDRPTSYLKIMRDRVINGKMIVIICWLCGMPLQYYINRTLSYFMLILALFLSLFISLWLSLSIICLTLSWLVLKAIISYRKLSKDEVGSEFYKFRYFLQKQILNFPGMFCYSWGMACSLFFVLFNNDKQVLMGHGSISDEYIVKEKANYS